MTHLDQLPKPSEKRIAIHVSAAAERAIRKRHPWLFDQAIRKQSHDGQPGDLAVVFDGKRRFLAVGLYDPDSPVRVKLLHYGKSATIDGAWIAAKLQKAAQKRAPLLNQQTNGYRLVHGENDGLPGLVVDRYAGTLVIKLYTGVWLPHLGDVIAGLQATQPSERIILRLGREAESIAARYGLHNGELLAGQDGDPVVVFEENGLRYAADVIHGHKTGFFFDQRDNRDKVRELANGRRVLDVFAYSGGFSLSAAAGGASSVTSLDVSAQALEAAQNNFALNQDDANVQAARHRVLAADAFEGLQKLATSGQRFDMVIVDPPSFAKRAAEVERALAAYRRLTRLAFDVMGKGDGIFVMASCSSRISANDFFRTVKSASKESGRWLNDIETTRHAIDHPIGFPEGAYLKCLFARV